MFVLSDGEEIMTLAFFVLIQYRSVTDGQTDEIISPKVATKIIFINILHHSI